MCRVSCTVMWCLGTAAVQGATLSPQQSKLHDETASAIASAMDEMCEGPTGLYIGMEKLRNLPGKDVAPRLVLALRTNANFRDPQVRFRSYQLLYEHRAAETKVGLDQLLTCLEGEPERTYCVMALGIADLRDHARVVDALGKLLKDADLEPGLKASVIRTLSRLGPSALKLLKDIEDSFSDVRNSEHVRSSAAYAILKLGNTARALAQVRNLDAVGERAFLAGLGRYGAETAGSFDTDRNGLVQIQKLVTRAIRSSTKKNRSSALEVLPVVVTGMNKLSPPGDTEKARMAAAVRAMIQDEGDADLRERAVASLVILEGRQ